MDRGSARRRLLPAAVCGLILAAVTAFAQSEPPGPASELVAEVSRPGGEYLLGLGLAFRRHRVLAYGSVLGFDPLGINLGIGYGNDSLQAIGLYRQHSPGRLPYLEASDRRGGLLLLEYTPPRRDLRLTLENELYVGLVELRTTALVLNLEYRLHFLFTVGGALGIDWQSISLAIEAGYNHADRGFVWGLGFKSFRQEATAESAGDRSLPALRRPTGS